MSETGESGEEIKKHFLLQVESVASHRTSMALVRALCRAWTAAKGEKPWDLPGRF